MGPLGFRLEPSQSSVTPELESSQFLIKWVFNIRRDAADNIKSNRARRVTKSFTQRESIDFTEVFAPVSKDTTLRTLLALAAADDLELLGFRETSRVVNQAIQEQL